MFQYAYNIARQDSAVVALLGSPPRFWPAGSAAQNQTRPYATYQIIYGSPDNSLSCPPEIDNVGVQVDCYGTDLAATWEVAYALRDAFESGHNQIQAWNGDFKEPQTNLYRVSFTVEFWIERGS